MQQTRTIRLEGEFNAPGIYTVNPGETLGQVIRKAGGLTPQAYLFGAEFLRESTQRDQQLRIEKYIAAMEQEVETASRNRLANANGDEVNKLAAEIQNQKQAVQRLRSVRATGRIVLNLQPGENDLSAIAGMTLENDDQFIVPAIPATINVMGDVYNPSSFVHSEKRHVKEYLKLAGGFTRNADEARSYIIRADGSVLPKQNTPNFSELKLNPGDTIVAPEHLFKTTFLTGLRTWSQVVSQLGLGAAAINVLR
jgi:protein involved in polysaccharide export with SLBB domain